MGQQLSEHRPVPTPAQLLTDFSLSVQPFVQDRIASPLNYVIGPNLTLLVPSVQIARNSNALVVLKYCGESSGPNFPAGNLPTLSPIATDVDYGSIA